MSARLTAVAFGLRWVAEVFRMTGGKAQKTAAALCIGLTFFLWSRLVHATVYGWRGEGGVLNLTNDPEDVPEPQRASAQTFTSKLAGKNVSEGAVTLPPPSPEVEATSAYERGLERGLQTAERQVALAGELARTVLAAVPPSPPTRIIIQQPPRTIVRYASPGYGTPFYGFIGPYAPYFFGGPYGFSHAYGFGRGRFVPHSHFFPGTRGRRRGLFFPHGHFLHHGFLFGHGFAVR
jgi:hypothetical protein